MSRRKSNIYKRKDGRYEGRYIKARSPSGKAIYGYVYAKSYNSVKSKVEEAMLQVGKSQTPMEKLPVCACVIKHISSLESSAKKSTICIYKRFFENHIAEYFQGINQCDLSTEVMQDYINYLSKKNLSGSSVRSVFLLLKKAVAPYDVSVNFSALHLPRLSSKQTRVFSTDEQDKLEKVIIEENNRLSLGVLICLYTGLRIGELCGLKCEDIDRNNRVIRVKRTIQRITNFEENSSKTIITEMSPKTPSSEREIPLPCFLFKYLSSYNTESGSDYILTGGPMPAEPRKMQYYFKKLLKKAQICDTNFHALRHSFAVRALENNFDIKTLSEILGHSSATVTLAKYAHSLNDHKRRKMEELTNVTLNFSNV